MSDPLNYRIIDELSFMTDSLVEPALARASDIDKAITRYYGRRGGSIAFGKDTDGTDLLRQPAHTNADPADPNMAILRRGGVEEVVDTTTGKIISPFARGPGGELIDNPEVHAQSRISPSREQSALLLTEEVPQSTPVSQITAPSAVPAVPTAPGLVSTRVAPQPPQPQLPPQALRPSAPPMPPAPMPVQQPQPQTFDDALGALLDAQGGAVNADAFRELERKFWALMRILAKKGLLTNDEFLRELRERE
jgi:hypothetical protein